ncbi:hypothetical protein BABA_10061 [Neobacillus bataviensis LMG 21833]|uniref:Uncharacterized protein n=1 Tax=Neobacillus bataviensis LMG 21833 TaxID=1117379 RepID=K6E7V8_9BACI|nr:phosphotransferase [Neobacillus bataviensis]EKN69396.1 hypothetical protein BABA_10061 [Neobacillus bataviensis LMG 21833]
MDEYIFLTEFISINKNIPLFTLAYVLFKCRPLMPRNPLLRINTIKYILKQKERNVVPLPVHGEIAIKVGDFNYKIISLREKAIYTVCNEGSETEIYEKLGYSHSNKMYEEIISVDTENKVIKGVFYNGYHPNIAKKHMKLNKKFCHLFYDLITNSDLKEVSAKKYAKSLYLDCLKILDRNSSEITVEQFNYVKKFILSRYKKIANEFLEDVLHLTLNHGDIKKENLIEDGKRLILIDWEFCDFRIPSHDLLQFMKRYPNLELSFYRTLFETLNNNLKLNELLYKELSRYFQLLGKSYLDIFYLEDIKIRLTQFENRNYAKDFSRYIVGYIKGIEEKST